MCTVGVLQSQQALINSTYIRRIISLNILIISMSKTLKFELIIDALRYICCRSCLDMIFATIFFDRCRYLLTNGLSIHVRTLLTTNKGFSHIETLKKMKSYFDAEISYSLPFLSLQLLAKIFSRKNEGNHSFDNLLCVHCPPQVSIISNQITGKPRLLLITPAYHKHI